jgi:carbonic anhydrase
MIDNIRDVLINGNNQYRLKILKELEKVGDNERIPKYPVLILTCMDPRIDIHRIFQINPGDVFILRNAGNLSTLDGLRSILLAIYQGNIKHIIVLGHLDCGMTKINLLELKGKVPWVLLPETSNQTLDLFIETRNFFQPFKDEIKNVKQQLETLQMLKVHNPELKILGMLYDVETGWVLEYDKLKDLASVKNLRANYRTILEEKQFQFIDLLETIEDDVINDKNLDEMKNRKESKEEEDVIISTELNNKDKVPDNIHIQDPKIATIFPKIQVPKLNFTGVKIHIPKIYRNRNEIKKKTKLSLVS